MPARRTLTASRNATWAPPLAYRYAGGPLPAIAHIAMQWRLYGGAPGDAVVTLNPIASLDTDNGDGTRTITLSPVLTPSQLAPLPPPNEPGGDVAFEYDVRITYADGVSELLDAGTVILSPGVTTV